jgi:hypothetical protein
VRVQTRERERERKRKSEFLNSNVIFWEREGTQKKEGFHPLLSSSHEVLTSKKGTRALQFEKKLLGCAAEEEELCPNLYYFLCLLSPQVLQVI